MVFYNLTSKELDSMRHSIKYGTKEYFEYSLVKMVDSVYCYDNYGKNKKRSIKYYGRIREVKC